MKKEHAGNHQSTQSELNFIRKLGLGDSVSVRNRELSREERLARRIRMLRGYLRALPMRKYWWVGAQPTKFRMEAEKQLQKALLDVPAKKASDSDRS